MSTEGTYKKEVRCSNCGYNGSVAVMRGVLIKDTRCPKCGCKTLV